MYLQRGGFIDRVAYGYRGADKPAQTNLCKLFWRFLLSLFIVWPSHILVVLPLAYTIEGLCFVFAFPFAMRPRVFKQDGKGSAFVPIQHWPKRDGQNFKPIWPMLAIAAGVGLWFAGVALYSVRLAILAFLTNHVTWTVANAMVFTVLLVWLIRGLSKSGTFAFVAAYVSAKKQRVCPTVTFVDASARTAAGPE